MNWKTSYPKRQRVALGRSRLWNGLSFPGENNPEQYFESLIQGQDYVTEIPKQRLIPSLHPAQDLTPLHGGLIDRSMDLIPRCLGCRRVKRPASIPNIACC